MFSKTKRRIMSAFIATTMAMTPLWGYADLVRGDGGTVDNIWAVAGAEGPDISTLTISDDQPGEGYILIGKYIDDYVNYQITSEDEGLMILANNSSLDTPPGLNVDYRLSGECYVTVTGLMIAFTDDRFPEYEGDKSVPSLLEFYTSDIYEDDEENGHWAERLNIEVFGEMDITDWFAANDLIIDEGAVFNIGYYDVENDEWHDGHVTAGNVVIGGEIHIGDKNEDGPESELIIFDDLSIQSTGKLTAACNACLVFGDMATCSAEGFPLKIRNEQGELVDFEFEDGHGRYEFVSRPVDEQDPETDIYWEYRDVGPERGENTYCVDYDDRGGEASVTVGEGEPDAIIRRPWDPYEFETGTAVVFKLNPPQGYNLSTAIVEIVEFAEDEDVNYSSELDPSDPHYIEINRENGTFSFTTSCYGYDVFISWSAYEFRFDRDSHFVVETHANDKGSVVFVDDSACERIEEDPYCPGNFRYLFNYDVFDEGNTLQIKFVPNANCALQDIGINLNGTETFYARENRPDHPTILFEDAQNLTDNGDGTYTWTISASSDWNEWYNVNAYFEKVINVSGIELEARDATKIEYSLDGGAYTTLESSMIGEGDGAHEGYYVSPETLDGHDSITFRFTYDNGVIKEGVRVEYAQNSNRKIDILPFDNDSNPYVFTLNKTGTTWNDYGIQVNDWPTPFNGTYLITKHGPGDVTVTGVATDVLTAYEDGQTLTFTVSCDEGIYKVVGRYSNDPNNGEFDIPCNEGTYTIQPNGGGLDIMIYTTQEEYNIDHLNANYGNGEFDFEIFVHEHGFHENDAQFDGEFTFVEDPHIKAFAASGNRTRFVVAYTDTELLEGKAKITLNLIPKYDCVYEVHVGGNEIEIVDGQAEVDLSDVISGARHPINIDVTYEEPKTITLADTEHVAVSYSLDGDSFTAFPEENILDLKSFPDIYEIYIKTEAEEGYVCDSIDIYVNGECIESRSETRGIYRFDVSDEWVCCEIRPIVRQIGGTYAVKCAREEDYTNIIFQDVPTNTPLTYYVGEDVFINMQSGNVYKAEAVNVDTGSAFELTRVSGNFKFDPPANGNYEITFYVSEEEYIFETLQGDHFAKINVVGLTDEAGTITCTGSTGSATYQGVMKFACPSDTAELTISANQGYDYTVVNDQNEDITAMVKDNNNVLSLVTGAGSWPTVTFVELPQLISTTTETTFTTNAGTEITMEAKLANNGAVVSSYTWSESTDDGENFTPIAGATGATLTVSPITTTIFKCKVTDTYGWSIDIVFTANVTVIPLVDETPATAKSVTITKFDEVSLTALVNTNEVTVASYVWSKSVDNGTTYTSMEGTGSSITDTPLVNTVYKCVVTDIAEQSVEIVFNVSVTVPQLSDERAPGGFDFNVDYTDQVTLDAMTNAVEPTYAWSESADGTTFTPILGASGKTFTYTPNADATIRCTVTDKYGSSIDLDFGVTVRYVLTDNTSEEDKDVTITKFETATLEPSIDASKTTGVTYAWSYLEDGTEFTDLTDTTASITVSPESFTTYKCVVSDEHGNTKTIVFTVNVVIPPLDDTREAEDKTFNVTYDGTTEITLEAKTNGTEAYQLRYTWSESSNGTDFTPITGASGKTFSFVPSDSTVIRCTVTDIYGHGLDLDFTVNVAFVLTDNTTDEAKSVTITKTESITLAPVIDSSKTTGVAYSWSCSTDDTFTSSDVSVTVTPDASTTYTCTVTDEHNNSCEIAFTVTVNDLPEISDTRTDSEKNVTLDYTDSAVLEAKTNAIEPTYKWFMLVNETFGEITDGTESTLTIEPWYDSTYRCEVTDKYGTKINLDFTCTVNYVLTDNTTDAAKSVTITKTESTTLAPVIDSSKTTGVTYAWFTSEDGTTYSDSSFSTAETVTVVPSVTTYYKCVVADEHNNSKEIIFKVTVTVPEIKDQRTSSEKSVTLTYGESKTLTAKTNAVEPVYTWLKSADGTNFTTISGETSQTLIIKPDANITYRCSVKDKYGTTIKLDYSVKVNFKLTDNTASSAKSVTITKLDSTTLEAKVSENTTTGVTYTWYSSTDGKNFTKMSDTTKSVKVTPNETTTYKCEVKDAHGNTVNVVFKVTVNVPVLKDLTSASAKTVTTDKDKDVTLEVKVNDTETTGIKYKWYKSTNGTSFNIVTGEKSSKITFKADSNVTYSCTVTDKYGNSIEVVFKVTVNEPATPTPDPDSESFGGFVERLYNVALGRESEPEGKEFWVKNVEAGNLTGADAAREFLNSAEFKGKGLSDEQFLAVLYETFFNRNYKDDPDGFNFWMNSLKSVGREKVVDGFINSEEWCNICAEYGIRSGATTAKATKASKNAIAFAERLYTCCLGREAEEGGLKFWSLSLTNLEVSGSEAARQFFTSAEFKGFNTSDEEYIKRLYTTFMGREYDEGGLNYWLGEMKGGMNRDQVFNEFAKSQEFTNICNSYGIQR